MSSYEAEAKITCPACEFAKTETMAVTSCQVCYVCKNCGAVLTPAQGDYCVLSTG